MSFNRNKSKSKRHWLLIVIALLASRSNVDFVLMEIKSRSLMLQENRTHEIVHVKQSQEAHSTPIESLKEPTKIEKGSEDVQEEKEQSHEAGKPEERAHKKDGLTHLYRLPLHLSSEEAYRNYVPPKLRKSSSDFMDIATHQGLKRSKPCHDWGDDLNKFCGEKPGCMVTFPINSTIDSSSTTCKTLWFSGMSMGRHSECKESGYGGYRSDYSIALRTAMHNARDTLQPVLLVGRYLMEGKKLPPIIEWYAEQGVIIITVDAMSFQPMMNEKLKKLGLDPGVDTHGGQFLRIDIHQIVQEHKLFDLPGICDRYVLYTDSDVMFVNPILQGDLDKLKRQIAPSTDAYILYGRQTKTTRLPVNNGVMMFDVYRFSKEWPSILQFGTENFPDYSYDQMWFNNYFTSSKERMANRSTLENEWNWKSYWPLKPNEWRQVKLVHSHGPKIGKGLEFMAQCNPTGSDLQKYGKTYKWFVKMGICCDFGMTAKYMLDLYHELSPPSEIRCSMTMEEM